MQPKNKVWQHLWAKSRESSISHQCDIIFVCWNEAKNFVRGRTHGVRTFLNDELWSDWCSVTIMWCSITCIASKSQEFMRLLYWNILHVNFLCSFYVVLMYFICQTFLVTKRQPLLRTMICIGEHEANLTDTNFKSISINFYDELIWLIAHV